MIERPTCKSCRWWGTPTSRDGGPFELEKPARPCKRFPPSKLWGNTSSAQAWGIGKSFLTFHDDWCGEHSPAQSEGEG